MNIQPYLKLMIDHKAESLVLACNVAPYLLVGNNKTNIGNAEITPENINKIFNGLTSDSQKLQYSLDDSVRFLSTLFEGQALVVDIKGANNDMSITILVDKRAKRKEKVSIPNLAVMGEQPENGELDPFPYLIKMLQLGGSDIFFTAESPVQMKLNGESLPLDTFLLTPDLTLSIAKNIMTKEQFDGFMVSHDLDMAIALPDKSARFRVNAFYQRGSVSLVLRLIPSEIPCVKGLGLPSALPRMVLKKRGLILIVGGTGSGKSTTMAAMIDHRNKTMSGHILTIEDPIEFSHPNLKSIVNQREVGTDTKSYATALKASLREAPDVILVGEIRNRETMESALELANTGHLCLATMHSNNANQALDRLANMFNQEQHKQLFMDLSANLVSVISQRLISNIEGGRSAAIEILVNTPHIASLILKGDLSEIKEAMQADKTQGTRTFDDALFDLFNKGKISRDEAVLNADSGNDLEMMINHK